MAGDGSMTRLAPRLRRVNYRNKYIGINLMALTGIIFSNCKNI